MTAAGVAMRRPRGAAKAAVLAGAAALLTVMLYSGWLQVTGGPARHLQGTLYAAPADTSLLRLLEARALLAQEPLSPVPFLVAAENAAARNDPANAMRLYEQALLRNPRSVAVRLWLVDRYLRQARFGAAVVQLDAVMRMRPTLRRQLVTVLVPLVGALEARRAVADALANSPSWKADFLDVATRDASVAPAYYELLYGLGGDRGFTLNDFELTRVVTSALARGDTRSAWMLYSRFVPRPAANPANLVFDADFRGQSGPPPFNWHLASASSGYAAIEPHGSRGWLSVHVYGGEPAVLATQSMLVDPGSYRVSTTLAPGGTGAVDGLTWRLICNRTRLELGRLEIGAASDGGSGGGVTVTVPSLCPVVSLVLAYAAPPRPVLGTVALTGVVMAPLGMADQ